MNCFMITHNFQKRIRRLCRELEKTDFDAVLVQKPANLCYFVGDSRPCLLLIITTNGDVSILAPIIDASGIKRHTKHEVISFKTELDMYQRIKNLFEDLRVLKIGVEKSYMNASQFERYQSKILPPPFEISDTTSVISKLRQIKSTDEIECIKRACSIADQAMKVGVDFIDAGKTEIDVAGEIEYSMRRQGVGKLGSPTYVASGPRTAPAHGLATNRKIRKGDLVLINITPTIQGYCAELCRMTTLGRPKPEVKKAYTAYAKGLSWCIKAAKEGATLANVEDTFADSLLKSGYRKKFIRPLLHGIGLDHAEAPMPPGHTGVEDVPDVKLIENMVLGIGNCGLYFPKFGVRIEDTILVTKKSGVELTKYGRGLV